MAEAAISPGAFLAFLDPHVTFLLVLLLAALFLFSRWLESADRSAYIVGTAAAIAAPVWVVGRLVVRFVDERHGLLPEHRQDGFLYLEILDWAFWGVGGLLLLAILWFMVRPLWLTGLFMMAPQGEVRRRYKSLEANWQLGIAALIAAKALVLLNVLLDLWL